MKEEMTYQFRTETGLTVCVRPLQPSDARLLVDIFEHLGPDSRYQRFNLPLSDPDPDWISDKAKEMADVPPAEGAAWLAFVDLPGEAGAPVAGARYLLIGPDTAEVSVAVRDALQGKGIGTGLLEYLAREAYRAGVRTLVGIVQSSNVSLWRSLANLDVPVTRVHRGPVTELRVTLSDALFTEEDDRSPFVEPF